MQRIPAREKPLYGGFHILINLRSLCSCVHCRGKTVEDIVFGNQPDAQNEGVAGNVRLRTGDRPHLPVNLRNGYAFQAAGSVQGAHRRRKMERNAVVFKALHDIAGKSRRFAFYLIDALDAAANACAFEGEPPRHNQPDVSAA